MNWKMGYVMKYGLFLQWQESYEESAKVLRCFQFIHKASKRHARKLESYKLKSSGSTSSVATEWLEFNIDSILKYLLSSFPRIHSLRRIMCYCKHALSSTCTSELCLHKSSHQQVQPSRRILLKRNLKGSQSGSVSIADVFCERINVIPYPCLTLPWSPILFPLW